MLKLHLRLNAKYRINDFNIYYWAQKARNTNVEYANIEWTWVYSMLNIFSIQNVSTNKLPHHRTNYKTLGVFILIIMNYSDDYETLNKILNQIINDVKYCMCMHIVLHWVWYFECYWSWLLLLLFLFGCLVIW